jgi:ribosomal protein S24E
MSTLEILSDSENKLLSRREVAGTFAGGSGLITRGSAADAISTKLGVKKELVRVISLMGEFGDRNLSLKAYVYSDREAADRQLPKYLSVRNLPTKDERKKVRDELKSKKKAKAGGSASKPSA